MSMKNEQIFLGCNGFIGLSRNSRPFESPRDFCERPRDFCKRPRDICESQKSLGLFSNSPYFWQKSLGLLEQKSLGLFPKYLRLQTTVVIQLRWPCLDKTQSNTKNKTIFNEFANGIYYYIWIYEMIVHLYLRVPFIEGSSKQINKQFTNHSTGIGLHYHWKWFWFHDQQVFVWNLRNCDFHWANCDFDDSK